MFVDRSVMVRVDEVDRQRAKRNPCWQQLYANGRLACDRGRSCRRSEKAGCTANSFSPSSKSPPGRNNETIGLRAMRRDGRDCTHGHEGRWIARTWCKDGSHGLPASTFLGSRPISLLADQPVGEPNPRNGLTQILGTVEFSSSREVLVNRNTVNAEGCDAGEHAEQGFDGIGGVQSWAADRKRRYRFDRRVSSRDRPPAVGKAHKPVFIDGGKFDAGTDILFKKAY